MNKSIVSSSKSLTKQGGPIYVGAKVVGRVSHGVFCKSIKGSMHLLRKPRAIAFEVSSLRDAEEAGAISARVLDTESDTVYTASLADIRKYGAPLDRGYGKQWLLTLNCWSVNGCVPVAFAQGAFRQPLQLTLIDDEGER